MITKTKLPAFIGLLSALMIAAYSPNALAAYCYHSTSAGGLSPPTTSTKKEIYKELKDQAPDDFGTGENVWKAFESAVSFYGLIPGYYHCTWSSGGTPKSASVCYNPATTSSVGGGGGSTTTRRPHLPPPGTALTKLWEVYGEFVRAAEAAAAAGQKDTAEDFLEYAEQVIDMINGFGGSGD